MKVIEIAGITIEQGESKQIKLPVARLYTDNDISMPIYIRRGKVDGPTLFLSAAIHGDELNGIEIIRRLICLKSLKNLKGTLIAVPMVNVYGVLNQTRYMPDRRDLNRSFPGSDKSSLAGRVANVFLTQIVKHCDYGIDLHTGSLHRTNIPQIRANLEDPETLELAKAFGVPVLLNANLRDGSLRQAAAETGTKILLYEAGEALRFDELSIRAGVKGILNVLRHLGMIRKTSTKKIAEPFIAKNSSWVRASASGIVKYKKQLGDMVNSKDLLAEIGDPFGKVFDNVTARYSGIIIGKQKIPLVQEGDAMYHIAYFEDHEEVAEHIEIMQDLYAT
ncbi:succinylglutamate desuccinylase/aspartoacylase family protein [Psychromonas antarctica]|jgi:predicted deacylase|uniref:succinylglutamate desuccinylase/aspartoacylase family protein n=1 Tax=Psychromonas antarctica TaxID=67573 RepID=UPI001EE9796C|nr:succinylglutamate desuccinylase/aspartoacylase family protein [Psychromonas antarctica]MCG6202453.1 succinylglutamate desuccinylase/aspartoacylase family protein [Psychromonas antarctica]